MKLGNSYRFICLILKENKTKEGFIYTNNTFIRTNMWYWLNNEVAFQGFNCIKTQKRFN